MYIYTYIYIYIHIHSMIPVARSWADPSWVAPITCLTLLICLIRPHLFCACFVVSGVNVICYIIHQI